MNKKSQFDESIVSLDSSSSKNKSRRRGGDTNTKKHEEDTTSNGLTTIYETPRSSDSGRSRRLGVEASTSTSNLLSSRGLNSIDERDDDSDASLVILTSIRTKCLKICDVNCTSQCSSSSSKSSSTRHHDGRVYADILQIIIGFHK